RYGIKNLKYIMNNLESWISEGDDTYEYREDLFIGIVEQLAMYVTHVAGNVGGYFVNEVKEGDTMPRFAQIPKAQQKEALNYLFEIYNDLNWLDNKNLLTKFPISGSPKQTIQN
ncbi:zinc-dependent metalloprotease, partial [Phocaeicola vulgatus]